MHILIGCDMGGTVGEASYHIPGGTIVEWHDDADARRMVAAGKAEEVGPLRVAEAVAAGRRVEKHPLIAFAKRNRQRSAS